jgi:hypothetical protein
MKKYTIQILMLLMLVVAMGTTSMAEVFNQQSNKLPRIETSKVIEYAIAPGYAYGYSLDANAGQEMTVRISSVENRAVFKIYSPLGKTLDGASEAQNTRYWRGILPVSGEYRIIVRGTTQAHTEFKLKIITQDVPYHNETNLNVFLNRLAPEKPEPNPMVSETKSVKRPASENSLLNILEAMNPVQSKPAAQVSKTGTSEANFVKMLEAMKAPVQPKKNEPVSETQKDNNASQANFVKMLEAMKVPVKIPAQSEKPESQAADKTEKSEVHQKSEAVAKRKSWAYKHTIHPTLPELTFKLIGSVQNAQTAEIAAIEFYQDNEQKPFQTFSNLDIPIAVPKKESSFKLKDMNSDGYQDFFLVTTSASEFYVCWVFDPKAKMFVKLLLDCGW